MPLTRTVLIEANRLFREGLKHLIADTRFAIDAEFNTIDQAVEGVVASSLVIIEGAGDLELLRAAYPEARIVVLASDFTVDALRDAMSAGADGYLMKDISPEALIQSLELVMMGEKVFPTNLASMLLSLDSTPSPTHSVRDLSPREQDILRALVTGSSNKVIAFKLGITEATVKVHLKTLLRKIAVKNRPQAAIWAINNGFSADGPIPTRTLQAVS